VFDLRAYNPHARLSSLPALEAGVLFVRLNNYFTEICSGSEEGSYLRLIDFCITQL